MKNNQHCLYPKDHHQLTRRQENHNDYNRCKEEIPHVNFHQNQSTYSFPRICNVVFWEQVRKRECQFETFRRQLQSQVLNPTPYYSSFWCNNWNTYIHPFQQPCSLLVWRYADGNILIVSNIGAYLLTQNRPRQILVNIWNNTIVT